MRSIAIRDELAGEWKKRGVKEHLEYSILTAENFQSRLRSHALGIRHSQGTAAPKPARSPDRSGVNFLHARRAATTEIARTKDAQGFPQNKLAAKAGGTVAGNARGELEKNPGRKIVSRENYLDAPRIRQAFAPKAKQRRDS